MTYPRRAAASVLLLSALACSSSSGPAQNQAGASSGGGKVDGSASFYDVIIRVSDSVRAPHYPMPLPVIARSSEERDLFMSLPSVRSVLELVDQAADGA